MNEPPWYTASEDFLLKYGKPAILLALGVVLIVTAYFFIQAAQGKKLVPAAAWATYLYMP